LNPSAIALVMASCSIHAGWNLLVKRSQSRPTFLWLAVACGVLSYAPAAIYFLIREGLRAPALPYALASGIIHSCYYRALSRMYEHDFSLTYPIARGTSPLLVGLASLLILRERLTVPGLAGTGFIVAGLLVTGLEKHPAERKRSPGGILSRQALQAAVVTGGLIAAYSLTDRAGVQQLHPVSYIWIVHAVALMAWGPILLRSNRATALVDRSLLMPALVVGLGQNLAYTLVLFAMRLAPVAYVVPLRELSIVIGVLLGGKVLKEQLASLRLGGALLIVVGATLISWRG